ncbi:unnamed protein product [Linum tenue]|uniref:ABC-type xenobiotic transporter n=1 Tax=Linum tenue TaxID=586396 RepID=A0AAV0LUG3_9ROSI|nr:unnamed protein product [Linum tenue]
MFWVRNPGDSSKGSCSGKHKKRCIYYNTSVLCSLGVSSLNLVLSLYSYFNWSWNGKSDDDDAVMTLFDLALRTCSWGGLSAFLHTQVSDSAEAKFPLPLMIWWGLYLSSSCYCLVVDIVLYSQLHASSQILHLVSDAVSVLVALFLCYVALFRYRSDNDTSIDNNTLLEEPLLDHDESSSGRASNGSCFARHSYAVVWSIFSFSWINSLIALGYKKALVVEDVPHLRKGDSVFGVFPSLKERIVESDLETITAFKLAKALFLAAWIEILFIAFLALLSTVASHVSISVLAFFFESFDERGKYKQYYFASTFLVAKVVECLLQSQVQFMLQRINIRTRALMVTMIYNKGLTLSCWSKSALTSGEIINMVTVDAERIIDLMGCLHSLWKRCESKHARMKATSETLRNMRVLKLHAWEMKFLNKIIGLRKVETEWLKKCAFASASISFYLLTAPTFVAVATFTLYMHYYGIPLDSGEMLTILAVFEKLQAPIYEIPNAISMLFRVKGSFDRIVSFLGLGDLPDDVVKRLPREASDTAIEIVEGSFSWDSSSPNPPMLRDVNLKVDRGMKVAVCGTVGSGKSSLLSCILGEVPKISGSVVLCRTKAYVAQSPWIQSGKIQDNILFGQEMGKDEYDRVLEDCALKKDLEMLSFGDQTEIGERGVNLSEGQKQRIQIARPLYQDADVYLFDDPFSAEDAHTGSHLFKEVLLGHLSSKTVVCVTHQVEFLPAMDLILVMKDGRITQSGKYSDICQSSRPGFGELFGAHKAGLSSNDPKALESVVRSMSKEIGETSSGNQTEHKDGNKVLQNGGGGITDLGRQLVQEEEREKGGVGYHVYWTYLSTASGAVVIVAEIVFHLLQYGNKKLLVWATGSVFQQDNPPFGAFKLIVVFLLLNIFGFACVAARSIVLAVKAYDTATLLFNKMHLCIFCAPMSFLDSNPTGRILGRASTDQSEVDQKILGNVQSATSSIIGLLVGIAAVSQVAWQVLLAFIPYIAIIFCYQIHVSKSSAIIFISAITIHTSSDVENNIVAAERILQYTSIPSENSLVDAVEQIRPGPSWPSRGQVDISSLQVRYAPHLPLVLRGLTCTFEGGKKTGIVGRTGSGKSTLTQTLFRIVEPTAGRITIDGVNISSIALHDLRSRLSIIPQDPTMFEGTVRRNLDPLEEYRDEQIWEALDKCHLGDEVRKKEKKLDSAVTENGENWSMGQRQLVCLGRVLLKKSKVLVLDEATSSVDTATDNLIQQTLRQHFFDCTVITIAHRITSVLDSNMVLLLSHGLIEEYDTPARLLENKSSSFAQLVAEYSESQLHAPSQILHLVSDAVSVLAGLFLCSAEFWRHRISHNDSDIDDSTLLEEPFLDHDESSLEPKKSTGDDIVTPYSCTGVWGLISFSWIGSLVAFGYKKALEVEDVPQLNKDDSVFGAFPSLKERIVESDKGIITTFKLVLGYKKALEVQDVPQLNRDDSVFGASPSLKESTITASKLAEALFFSVWKEILMIICLTILSTATYLVSTIMIISLVPVDEEGRFTHQGYIFFPILFLVSNAVDCLSQSQVRFRLQCIGIRTRASLVTMIYNKGLTLSYQSKLAQSSGEIINVVTVDAERISDLIGYLYHLCFGILNIFSALSMLGTMLGFASIVVFAAIVVIIWIGFSLLRWQKTYQERVRESKKERMKATSETLRNMRVLKLQAWEMKFLDKIIGLRKAETGSLRMCAFSSAFISFYYSAASTFVAVVTFAFFDMPIDSGQMLAALNSFSRLQVPIYELPKSISMLYEVKVSFGRIVGYLRLHDLPNDAVKRLQGGSSDIAIEIVEGSFSWDSSSPNPPTLRDVNLKVCRGMKVAVCGAVGSGKSSLLSCILGEVPKMSGLVELCGTKAYVDQSPWIQSGKIKDNILFGQEMDKDKYDRVLEACALKKDLKIFSFGDQTEIGERGVNLSEGQKQRIQIARALYQDADIYLLDDPFSAEDAHTGSHLLKEVLLGHLSSKTVVYVTHQVEFLSAADLILIMKDGRITQSGKYSEICQSSGTDFGEIFGAHKVALSAIDSKHLETAVRSTSKEIGETSNSNQAEHRNGGGITDQGQLVKKEERGVGRVWFSLYWKYLSTASAGAIAVAAELVFQLLQYGNKKLLAWASGVSSEQEEPIYRVLKLFTVYVVLTIAGLACQVARTTVLAVTAYETATRLFNKMHLCIFSAPMAFLDSTPTGRIIGRVAWQVYLVMIPYIAIGFCCQVRYAESLPLVLRGLTCTFEGGKKTGIVGRTGCGKSTLIQTLFRIVDPTVGQIMIDGVDISTIGSRYLRSRLSIIPQDPTMFEGTVRSNLDPLGQYPDEQIWEALDKCQLGDEVRKKEKKLDSAVTENGENWSMGQRQLVCLGRVLLKKSKVLVLDEATASVDTATDNLIQQTLRQHFFECTVITIAHRITSVLDSDMVLLLSHGLIEEYDTPARLLENKLSSFSQLVAEYSESSKEQY